MNSLIAGFADPVRRPRYIITIGLGVLMLALFAITALGVTSTRWFCANACHKVQDDTIEAYNHSAHSQISCMACHGNVDGNPVKFVAHKAEALGELYLAVTNKYELPLNANSEVSAEMPSEQCTQCHTTQRRITPSEGIIIDHAAHAKRGINCTTCHNRVAHNEDFTLKLKDPKTGKRNTKHVDNMTMTACFRCHGQEEGSRAPGQCELCHPKNFQLKPASHFQPGFYTKGGESGGHAKLALADEKRVAANKVAEGENSSGEGVAKAGEELPSANSISYCGTCHDKSKFCVNCHGVVMPHPKNFVNRHGDVGKKSPQVCANCHAKGQVAKAGGTQFCNNCHHKGSDPNKSWISQHYVFVRQQGANACFRCHKTTYCAKCHVNGSAQ